MRTLVSTNYGINCINMPELGWPYGYPLGLLGTGLILRLLVQAPDLAIKLT